MTKMTKLTLLYKTIIDHSVGHLSLGLGYLLGIGNWTLVI